MAKKEELDVENILNQNVEIPENVKNKMDLTLTAIREDNRMKKSKENSNQRKMLRFRKKVAAAMIVGILVAGGGAAAAVHYFWSDGMQGAIRSSKEQQKELVEDKIATVLNGEGKEEVLAVKSGDITIKPMEMIVDKQSAYLTFSVEGYQIQDSDEPCFEEVTVEDRDAKKEKMEDGSYHPWDDINSCGKFYDGIVSNPDGSANYADGSELRFIKEGELVCNYVDENGNMEYIVELLVSDPQDSLLGKTIHFSFRNLGTVYKTEYTNVCDGTWDFDIELSAEASAEKFETNYQMKQIDCIMESVELSPISIRVNFSEFEQKRNASRNYVPWFQGVVLKDGTEYLYLRDMGQSGYEGESGAYMISGFSQVIDPEQVDSIIFAIDVDGEEQPVYEYVKLSQ